MSDHSTALDEILAHRKERAKTLQQLTERSANAHAELLKLQQNLPQIDDGQHFAEDIQRLTSDSSTFIDKANRLHKRLDSDSLTFALVGLEKAGKSTFINNFAKLFLDPYRRDAGGYLPSGEARCTASIAELCNSDSDSLDVVYYSAQELVEEIVNPMLRLVGLKEVADAKEIAKIRLDGHQFGAYPEIQERLQRIQQCASFLTADERIESGKAVTPENLAQYLSHDSTEPRLPLVKKCVIYRPLAGSAAKIRFIDTPGINDPNPNARQKTLSIVKKEADIIVMASRPVKPSLENNDASFLEELYKSFSGVDLTGKKIVWLMNTYCVPKDQNFHLHKADINKRTQNSLGDRIYKCDFLNEDLTPLVNQHILGHAKAVLPEIDQREMAVFQQDFDTLRQSLAELAKGISERYRGETVDQEAQFFDAQFSTWFESFTQELARLPDQSANYAEYNGFALQEFAEWQSKLNLPSEDEWNKWTKTNRANIGGILAQDFHYHTFKFLREVSDEFASLIAGALQEDVLDFFNKLGCSGIYAQAETPRNRLIALRDSCKNLKNKESADLVSAFTDLIEIKNTLSARSFSRFQTFLSEMQSFSVSEASAALLENKIKIKILEVLSNKKYLEKGIGVIGSYSDELLNTLIYYSQENLLSGMEEGLNKKAGLQRGDYNTLFYIVGAEFRIDYYCRDVAQKIHDIYWSLKNSSEWVSVTQKQEIETSHSAWMNYTQRVLTRMQELLAEELGDAESQAIFVFNDLVTQLGSLNARFKFLGYPSTQAHSTAIRAFIHTNREQLGFLTESDAAEQMRLFREIQKSCVILQESK